MFYVLEGHITSQCGEDRFDLEKGGFVFLPHGIEHSYIIHSQEAARGMAVTSPIRENGSKGWKGFVGDMESGQGELIAKPPHASGAGLRLPDSNKNGVTR